MIKKPYLLIFTFAITCLLLLSACQSPLTGGNQDKNKIVITDMTQRNVKIPASIKKVYATSPIGTITLYTLAPDMLTGWNYKLTPEEKKYILKEYHDLPVLGGWFGKNNTGNMEDIIKAKPDIIINMGPIDNTNISNSQRIQEQTGIPVVMIDEDIKKLPQAYRFLGKLLSREDEAEKFGKYCDNTLFEAENNIKLMKDMEKVRVYYAEGPKGLETDGKGSIHCQVFEIIGAENAAGIENAGADGRQKVSLEQLITWNPQVIIKGFDANSLGPDFYDAVFNDPSWQSINAVKDRRVYIIPQYPFNWFDRPYSANRLMGVKWLGNLLYPEFFKYDIEKEVREFYSMFYHYELNDSEIEELLKYAK